MSSPAKAAKASPTHAATSPSKVDQANGSASVTDKLKESLSHTKEKISEGLAAIATSATQTAKKIEDVISDQLGVAVHSGEVADDKENQPKQAMSSPKNTASINQADKAGDGTLNADGSVGTVATDVSAVVDKSFADPAPSLPSPSNVPVTVNNNAVIGAIESVASNKTDDHTNHSDDETTGTKRNAAAEEEKEQETAKKQKTAK